MRRLISFKPSYILFCGVLMLSGCGGSEETATTGAAQVARSGANFTQLFSRTVAHPRCVNCHAFAEGSATTRRYQGRSRNCESCHAQDDFRESTADMTFTNRSASQICNTSVQRRGSTEALATLLRTSPHVRWGIEDGSITSTNARLPLAPPQNHAIWLALIDRWVASGCSSCE